MLSDREQVLALNPDYAQLLGLSIGVVAPWNAERDGDEAQFEVRAFCAGEGMPEDPVTGSLNAGLAQWLIGDGLAPSRYVASRGRPWGEQGGYPSSRLATISGWAVRP